MCTFIGIESVAANALIELFEKKNIREVSFDILVKYGMGIVRYLEKERREEVILLFSRKYQISMIENYSDFFEADFYGDGNGVFRLKGNDRAETLRSLKEYFRWTMSTRMINAFLSKEALDELKIAA